MITVNPVRQALLPVNANAAQRLCSENYDEFQSDDEITELLKSRTDSVLKITMPHCNLSARDAGIVEGSQEALEVAKQEMESLKSSDLTRLAENALLVYEITDAERTGVRQIGLVGMALNEEIRTASTPNGSIIRNEGIRAAKAEGRADLIRATNSIIGMVMNAVDDKSGAIAKALEQYADARPCDYEAEIESGVVNKIWVIEEPEVQASFQTLMSNEPCAYVADGNHRSAAAAMFGRGEFLSVFFPASTMGLAPYNRLVNVDNFDAASFVSKLEENFSVEKLDVDVVAPTEVHDMGIYAGGTWYRLTPHNGAFDPSNAAQSIDADIVQRKIFDHVLGITDSADERLKFVGGNHDAAYLKARVDAGAYDFAISLAPVTIEQFIEVCRQNLLMPPKSTWFQPKIRSGLVISLLEESV